MYEFIIVVKQSKLVCVALKQHHVVTLTEVESNQEALSNWLTIHEVKQVKLILDLMEEELYVQHHPSLYLFELKAYAEQQKKRRFPVTAFSRYQFSSPFQLPWSQVQGSLLISGFNEDAIIVDLMNWLEQSEVLVDSIHSSMSVLYRILLNTWFYRSSAMEKLKSQPIVLLVREGEHDFRQLLVVNGMIRTNRQLYLDSSDHDGDMQILLQELTLLEKFAKAQKMISATDGLFIYYIGLDASDCQQARSFFAQTSFAALIKDSHFADMQTLMSSVVKQNLYDRFLVLVLSSAQLTSDYHPNAVQKAHQVKKARLALWISVVSAFLFMVGYLLNQLTYMHEMNQSLNQLVSMKQDYQSHIDRFNIQNKNGEISNYNLQHIKLAVEAVEVINAMQQRSDVYSFLVPISHILSNYSDIHLTKLDFSKSILPAGNENGDGVKSGFDQVLLLLEIEIEPQSRLSDKLERVDGLIRQLNEVEPKGFFSAQLVKVPFNIDSRQHLSLKINDTEKSEKMGAEFEVAIRVSYD